MSYERGFLLDIEAHPEDPTPRLILADWLEEHGDPRSDLLRREVEVAEILGWQNVHGVLSLRRFYGKLDDEVFLQAIQSLPNPHQLKEDAERCKEEGEHLFVLYPGLDVRSIRSHADRVYEERTGEARERGRLMYEQAWYEREQQTFAVTTHPARYHLVPKEPLFLFDRTWIDLVEFDAQDSRILRPRGFPHSGILLSPERMNMLLLHEQDTRERLDAKCSLRCLDQAVAGNHVNVGYFGAGGLYVGSGLDDYYVADFGLASFREFGTPKT